MNRTLAIFLLTCGSVLVVLGIALAATDLPQAPLGVYLAIVGLAMGSLGGWPLRRSRPSSARVRAATEALLTIFLTALVLVSGGGLVARMRLHRDVSSDRANTLAPVTARRLAALSRPVRVIAFLTPTDPRRGDVSRLLQRCRAVSRLFEYEVVDPDERPSLAQELGATRWGLMVASCGTRTVRVRGMDEAHLDAAFRALGEPSPQLAFLTGHGERDPQGLSSADLGKATDLLEAEGFGVRRLDLTGEHSVPGDLRACIIAGPRHDLTQAETRALEDLVERGGRLLVLLETLSQRLPHLDELLASLGIDAPPALVLDLKLSAKGDLGTLLVPPAGNHPVTLGVPRRGLAAPPIVLTGCRPLVPADKVPPGVTVVGLAASSDESWGAADAPRRYAFDPTRDRRGPLTLAVAVTLGGGRPVEGRAVVVGGASWISDAYLDASANRDFLLSAIAWLTARDVDPVLDLPSTRTPVVMTEGAWDLLAAITVLGIPLMWAASALMVALVRR